MMMTLPQVLPSKTELERIVFGEKFHRKQGLRKLALAHFDKYNTEIVWVAPQHYKQLFVAFYKQHLLTILEAVSDHFVFVNFIAVHPAHQGKDLFKDYFGWLCSMADLDDVTLMGRCDLRKDIDEELFSKETWKLNAETLELTGKECEWMYGSSLDDYDRNQKWVDYICKNFRWERRGGPLNSDIIRRPTPPREATQLELDNLQKWWLMQK